MHASTRLAAPSDAAHTSTDARCANCDTPLHGPYCAECGQHAHESARSLGTLFHDAWHVLTHVDGRLWQTLRRLAFSPGYLTHEYFAERRARYIPPFRLYLILSLVFFGLTSFTRGFETEGAPVVIDTGSRTSSRAELERDLQEIARARVEMREKGMSAVFMGPTLDRAEQQVQARLRALDAAGGARSATSSTAATAPPATERRTDPEFDAFDPAKCENLNVNPPWLARLIEPTLRSACLRASKDGGRSILHAFVVNIPKMMLVFLPLLAAMMLLLYWWPRRYYVEHLVFYLHVHAAIFLGLALLTALGALANLVPVLDTVVAIGGFAFFFYAVWYAWRALRVYYGNGRLLTAAKFAVIVLMYLTCLSLTALGGAFVTALEAA